MKAKHNLNRTVASLTIHAIILVLCLLPGARCIQQLSVTESESPFMKPLVRYVCWDGFLRDVLQRLNYSCHVKGITQESDKIQLVNFKRSCGTLKRAEVSKPQKPISSQSFYLIKGIVYAIHTHGLQSMSFW